MKMKMKSHIDTDPLLADFLLMSLIGVSSIRNESFAIIYLSYAMKHQDYQHK